MALLPKIFLTNYLSIRIHIPLLPKVFKVLFSYQKIMSIYLLSKQSHQLNHSLLRYSMSRCHRHLYPKHLLLALLHDQIHRTKVPCKWLVYPRRSPRNGGLVGPGGLTSAVIDGSHLCAQTSSGGCRAHCYADSSTVPPSARAQSGGRNRSFLSLPGLAQILLETELSGRPNLHICLKDQLIWMPLIARLITRRWTSLVPSKMV